MPSLPPRSYAEILDDLDGLEKYLTQLGLPRPYDRLRRMIANIREIEKVYGENRAASLEMSPRVEELVWSLVEGQEFAEIFRGVRDYDPDGAAPLLRKALSGPVRPTDEKEGSNSNFARNTIFELLLAARLRRAGASTRVGQEADIIIDYLGGRLYIECKRPLDAKKIPSRAREACRQLKRRFEAETFTGSLGGLVAVSITKALNRGDKMYEVDQEEQFLQLSAEVQRIHRKCSNEYSRLIDPRIVGVSYHIFTPARIRTRGLSALSHTEFFLFDTWPTVFPVAGDALKQLLRNSGSAALTDGVGTRGR
jgi:hypothetical protein